MANTKITNPELFNLGDSTLATQLPVMTTTERIAITTSFTLNVDYLVVAGGGAGGSGYRSGGGGSGVLKSSYSTQGGGQTQASALSLATGSGYTVTVGDGGDYVLNANGSNGGDSIFESVTSLGGGGGGGPYSASSVGSSGGTGGGGVGYPGTAVSGGSATGSPAYGYSGGNGSSGDPCGGGGGGAGAVGNPGGSGATNGDGGVGIQNNITVLTPATGPHYAGGGGGGNYAAGNPTIGGNGGGGAGGTVNPPGGYAYTNATPGTDGLGGGGGGSSNGVGGGSTVQGANGGSGIVILRYPTADVASYTATGLTPTETTVGTDTVLSFTTVGTGTISFTSSAQGSLSVGEMIFNSDTDKVEYFDGTKWYGITYGGPPPSIFLDANNATSYPGTGTTWFDLTSNGNNGAITSANFVNSSSPYYFNFGSGKYVTTTYSLPTSGGVSIELWFNANSGVSSYMAGNNNASNALRNAIFVGDFTGSFANESISFYQSTGLSTGANYVIFAVEEGNTKYQDGAWHQLFLIDTGSGHEVYVDGASKTLTYETTAGGPSTRINWTNFSLSKANWNSGGYMNGSIGQCSIYEKALTQSEVLASFNSTKTTYGL